MLYLIPALSQGFVAAPAAGKAVAPRVSGANMAALAEEYLIAPSILSADFANLGKEVSRLVGLSPTPPELAKLQAAVDPRGLGQMDGDALAQAVNWFKEAIAKQKRIPPAPPKDGLFAGLR